MRTPAQGLTRFITLSAISLLSAPMLVADDGFTQHGAHVHGVATLLIAIEGEQLSLLFDSPGMNLVGFESSHPEPGQRALVDATRGTLADPASIVSLPAAAGCVLQQVNVQVSGIAEEGHDHDDHDHDHSHDHGHMDFLASYELICRQPQNLQDLSLPLFTTWPGVERVNVAWVLASGQGAATLSAVQPSFRLR